MSRGHSRRSLFGIGDAGGATLLLAATEAGEAKAAELDAELLAACATFQREEAYHRQQYARVIADEISERDADLLIEKREEAYHDAADVICETPARTPEGLRAKAAAVVAFYSPDAPTGSIMDDSMWSVLCQVAGKPEEDVEKKGVAHDHPHASDRHTIQQWSDTR